MSRVDPAVVIRPYPRIPEVDSITIVPVNEPGVNADFRIGVKYNCGACDTYDVRYEGQSVTVNRFESKKDLIDSLDLVERVANLGLIVNDNQVVNGIRRLQNYEVIKTK